MTIETSVPPTMKPVPPEQPPVPAEAGPSHSVSSSTDEKPHEAEEVTAVDSVESRPEFDVGSPPVDRFVWQPVPAQEIPHLGHNGFAQSFRCDICEKTGFVQRDLLKIHQIQSHINPQYLSEADRQMAHLTGPPWPSPEAAGVADTARLGLFRCHLCHLLWHQRSELSDHLAEHAFDEASKKNNRPEDFEEKDTRPLSMAKRSLGSSEKENTSVSLQGVFKLSKKRRIGRSKVVDWSAPHSSNLNGVSDRPLRRVQVQKAMQLEPVIEDEVLSSSESNENPNRRPERQCKFTTNALVSLSIEDETLDVSFESSYEVDSEDDKPLKNPRNPSVSELKKRKQTKKSGGKPVASKKPPVELPAQKGGSTKSESHTHIAYRLGGNGAQMSSQGDDDTSVKTTLTNQQQSVGRSVSGIVVRKKRRKRPLLTKKPKKSRSSQRKKTADNVPESRPSVNEKDSPKSRQTEPKDEPSSFKKMISPSIEEILPDLNPNPKRRPIRRASEVEKATTIVKSLTIQPSDYICLQCNIGFTTFSDLFAHRQDSSACQPSEAAAASTTSILAPLVAASSESKPPKWVSKSRPYDHDFADYMSNSIRAVPETTFNNLHGTINHIDSQDGLYLRSKTAVGTLEKVKMNMNGSWTTRDVWGCGGWEISRNLLSWHKFENAQSENRKFLQGLSSFPWSEQQKMKVAFDQALTKNRSRKRTLSCSDSESACPAKSVKKRSLLLQGLDLKQLGRSVKYMTASEFEDRKRNAPKEYRYVGDFNGEWENEHVFMCSVCAEIFDDLREVMHHKWDAHPYCLVSHLTMQAKLNLPNNGMMYPKLGRQLLAAKPTGDPSKLGRGRRASKSVYADHLKLLPKEPEMRCTKCADVQDSRDEFYAHILVCGGEVNWEEGKKKKKKKKSLKPPEDLNPEKLREREEAALKRKARFAKFDQPPPVSGRNTRFQKDLIKKTRNEARLEKRLKKRTRKPTGFPAEPNSNEVKPPKKPATESSGTTSARDSPLPDRPRRSTVNYARDKSLRDSYDSNGSNKQKRDLQVKIKEFEEESEFVVREEENGNHEHFVSIPSLTGQKPRRRFSDSDLKIALIPEKVSSKRRASLSDLSISSAEPQIILASPSFGKESKPISAKRRATHNEESIWTSSNKGLGIKSKKRRLSLDIEVSVDRKSPPKSSTGAIRVTLDYSPSQLKDLERLPPSGNILAEEVPEHLSDNDDKLSTDSGASSSSTVSSSRMRKKRRSSPSLLASDGRLIFPKEVKISALERIQNGETQIQVARDLQCPISTVSTWWKKREILMALPKRAESETELVEARHLEADESGISSPSHDIDCVDLLDEPSTLANEVPITAIVPYRRNELLQAMKNAFKRNSDVEQQEETNSQTHNHKSPVQSIGSSFGLSLIADSYDADPLID
ncbi:hypothetical protein TCAL_08328 [Tigriopus californicus]|uniref:C2H2-type domain-containing protein n=1 Tax=Tigriopus californicus TaxID=6832 RepID=A0A553PPU0_TIGCA|nr:uncharacterized protein LOC131881802 [Tigriopus californicus]TRY79698.1 hypothetical protein TCAL_08328 [Tigriopus californicus]|eukprot:TCALIF_08328-PA protein Name:"Protein of unknown function" AED:0.00 eAED:0.00 QI:625/1/1/1/0.66/0.5/4/503/1405